MKIGQSEFVELADDVRVERHRIVFAAETVARGDADAIAFGRYFISNPDLPERIRQQAAFTPYNRPTFYGGGEQGYTDYAPLGKD